jgi:hypothetical protein
MFPTKVIVFSFITYFSLIVEMTTKHMLTSSASLGKSTDTGVKLDELELPVALVIGLSGCGVGRGVRTRCLFM